ncbi:nitroreductase family protein [Chloroflexota bacterium]
MLNVWEAINTRRSIRRFTSEAVPEPLIEQILEAARLAPSASNRQPWRFLVIRDENMRKELRRICLDQKFIEEAPVLIVCFGDLDSYSMTARKKRREEMAQSGVLATLSGRFANAKYRAHVDSLPTPPPKELHTPVVANTYIAIEHLVLMATALGLGTCWVGGFTDAAEINRLLDLRDTLIPVAVIPVGYPAGELPPPRPRLDSAETQLKV